MEKVLIVSFIIITIGLIFMLKFAIDEIHELENRNHEHEETLRKNRDDYIGSLSDLSCLIIKCAKDFDVNIRFSKNGNWMSIESSKYINGIFIDHSMLKSFSDMSKPETISEIYSEISKKYNKDAIEKALKEKCSKIMESVNG